VPLAVSDLRLLFIQAALSVRLIQLYNMSDFRSETCDLFLKNVEVIHTIKDS
jgi:hypothetical protein